VWVFNCGYRMDFEAFAGVRRSVPTVHGTTRFGRPQQIVHLINVHAVERLIGLKAGVLKIIRYFTLMFVWPSRAKDD
jgi:hypothetical protein